MKKLFTISSVILLTIGVFLPCQLVNAQSPEKMSYQAVVRNSGGALVTNQGVGVKISILQGSPAGTLIYQEIYNPNPQTNENGLLTLEIGGGIALTGTFSSIDWASGPFFLKTETDPTGGTNYTITGTSQLLSVPYALHAKTAEGLTGTITENDPVYTNSQAANIMAGDITNLSNLSGVNTGDQDLSGLATTSSTTAALNLKVDKEAGKGLSTNDYTTVEQTKVSNLSGSNTGDNAINSLYSGLLTNATHTGDVTGANELTLATVNSNLGTFNNVTINAKGQATAGSNVSYLTNETDPTVKVINGIVKSNGTTISAAVPGDFPVLNQNTTGNAATATSAAIVTSPAQPAITSVGTLTSLVVSGTTTVITPVNATDATNKAYVDELKIQLEELQIASGLRVKDIDGNLYKTVTIGAQVWMAENLKTTRYNDGTDIPNVTDNTSWATRTTPAYCWYNNDETIYNATYGALYNWYTVNGGKNVCPTGWHVPTDGEWTTLENYLITNGYNYDGTTTGNKIAKALASTTLWISSANVGAVGNTDYPEKRNSTGFTALPGGKRENTGTFFHNQANGNYWSATESSSTNAVNRLINYTSTTVYSENQFKEKGFSVRCLKD